MFVAPLSRDPSLSEPWMKEDTAMAVGPALPGPEQETDGENHVLKHTALPALLRLGWLWGAKGPQAQALHRTARGCKSDYGT